MASKFFSRFTKPAIIGLLAIAPAILVSDIAFGAPQTPAQENAEQENAELTEDENEQQDPVEKKVIHEPIHRVLKVANRGAAVTQPNPPVASAPVADDNVKRNNELENANLRTPAILPSVIHTLPVAPLASDVPVPSTESPSVNPNAGQSKIPATLASSAKPVPHPLDDALEIARRGLRDIRANVRDYTAIMVKRERIGGELQKPEYMQVKVRSEQVTESGQKIPFGIYMKFIKPRACAGREVIWVEGRNENKLFAHEGSGLGSFRTFHLDPTSWLAMKGQRYPISDAGMENLIVKLIEKAERDRAAGDCIVEYRTGVKINGRDCEVIQVTHPEQRAPYDFHIAKIYIDTELRLPIRYQAHLWPETENAKPKLLEEYTYLNIKINQGLTDEEFNPRNPRYKFPKL